MTIILPFNTSGITDVYLFLKKDNPGENIYDICFFRNEEQILNPGGIQIIDYSDTTRYLLLKLSTDINGTGDNNFPFENEGWYDWKIKESGILYDEGQIFIGDYDDSETEKVYNENDTGKIFYEK